jgi:Bacteriophage protein gp37
MAETSGIEWTDATVNFWWGCTKVGPGCDWCYAETWAARFGEAPWGPGVDRRKIKGAVKLLYKLHNDYAWWAADAQIGQLHPNSVRRVFIQSMSDLFDKEVPLEWLAEAWKHITACDRLAIQIVTKRVTIVEKRLEAIGNAIWPQHAGLIISVVNQDEADRDIPRLIALKQKLSIPWIGLSMEPLLGPVKLETEWLAALDWVIVGGESGANARPMNPRWARNLRDQCEFANVAFLFKQWGEWTRAHPKPAGTPGRYAVMPNFEDSWAVSEEVDQYPRQFHAFGSTVMERLGKKKTGRLLDGVEHNGMPGAFR